jgi:hypothetical protein
MAFLLFLAFIGSVLFAWYSVFWIIPGGMRESYVTDLRLLQAKIVDEIRDGSYKDKQAAAAVLDYVKAMIDNVREVSPAKIWMLRLVFRSSRPVLIDLSQRSTEADRPRLQAHLEELERLSTRHARWGTPSGWLVGWLSGFRVGLRDTALLLEASRHSSELAID